MLLRMRTLTLMAWDACRVEAMQQGAEGTERFCIKQLLKPIDNVRCWAYALLMRD